MTLPQFAMHAVRKNANLLLLLLALALGQGVTVIIFLGLAWAGRADLVGAFSLGVQMASLALFFADFGGAFYLSRLAAARVRGGRTHVPRKLLANLLLCRLLVAAPAMIFLLWVALAPVFNEFTSAFLVFAAPAILIQAFNIAGALDGAGRAGAAGLSNTLYFVLPTLGLLFQATVGIPDGHVLGALFTLGVAGSVALQYLYVRVSGRVRVDLVGSLVAMPRAASVERTHTVTGLFLYAVSGQILARGQIIIAGLFFPLEILGAIALAKQIANGANQVVGLFRRIELPRLVQRARMGSALSVIEGIRLQKWGTLAAVAAGAIFIAAAFMPVALVGEAGPALFLLATHAPAIFTTAILAAAMQTCIARNESAIATISAWTTTSITLAGIWFVSQAQIASALFLVEAGVQMIVFAALFAYTLRR